MEKLDSAVGDTAVQCKAVHCASLMLSDVDAVHRVLWHMIFLLVGRSTIFIS
jgi:hypothetical protein